ncbi:MAG TPA: neuraminidase-like domain-containing protein [Gaiellaceae bacterium]
MWTWLRSYRVWSANLKTFLWPENWLNPDGTTARRRRRRRRP